MDLELEAAPSRATREGERFETAFRQVISDLVESGAVVPVGGALSVGSGKDTWELLNYQFTLESGHDRFLSARPISAIGAVGRFVWMLSGSNRLADIAFYEPKVRPFTDDGISVPGSDYGARLLSPRPDVNQIANAINILRTEPGSRRAAAAVFHPEDSGRQSRDIPCTFGLFWQERAGRLHTTTIMRSNNAWTLLPYNVFEFTLLAELIAADVGLELGQYTHFAVSMHLYEENVESAKGSLTEIVPGEEDRMPLVPTGDVWGKVQELLAFEVALRYATAGITDGAVRGYLEKARQLGSFWSDLAVVIVAAAVRNQDLVDSATAVLDAVTEPLRTRLAVDLRDLLESGSAVVPPETANLYLALARTNLAEGSRRQQESEQGGASQT